MGARPDEELPPSVLAAKRSRSAGRALTSRERAYPSVPVDDDVEAVSVQLAATRALVAATTPEDVAAVVATLVHDLGGGLVPARLAQPGSSVQLDVSFGLTEPLLPWADPVSVASMRLTRVLPGFMADARGVLDRLHGDARRTEEADVDVLTGLLTRRAWMRRLASASAADAVCLLDLDHFKAVNDGAGHGEGDRILRAVGQLVLRTFRPGDACGRYGGDELACLVTAMPVESLAERVEQLRSAWHAQRPASAAQVGLSAGLAQVAGRDPQAALKAADRALYRAKAGGRDATALATAEDDQAAEPT